MIYAPKMYQRQPQTADLKFQDPFLAKWWHGQPDTLNAIPFEWKETETSYLFAFELPGFDKANISIRLQENILEVKADRAKHYLSNSESESASDSGNEERKEGRVEVKRRLKLGKAVQMQESAAKYDNGILFVTLSKKDELTQSQMITIE